MAKEIRVAFGVHCDAVAGWLGSYGGEDSPCDISRGVFAAEVGMPRLLKLFDRAGLRTTWFIPGHTAESFPEQTQQVAEAGGLGGGGGEGGAGCGPGAAGGGLPARGGGCVEVGAEIGVDALMLESV